MLITDTKDFQIKSVSKYHNLYIRKDPVLLANVLADF